MTDVAFLTLLLVPPANLAVLALAASVAGWRGCTTILLAMLLALGAPEIASGLLASLDLPASAVADAAPPAQAILVLGGDLDRDGDGVAVPGRLTLERVRDAVALARSTRLPVALTGGPIWPEGPAVAAVMATEFRREGIDPRWVETRSLDTWENARDSAAMLHRDGIRHVLLVTNAWHMRRALLAFRGTGLDVVPAPVRRAGSPRGAASLGAWVPQPGAWVESYDALHEWIGLVFYHLRALLA